MAEGVARTVDARPFAVPHAEHAVEPALAAQFGLLRARQRGRGELLVGGRVELDIAFREYGAGAHELLVECPERRTPIARHVACRVEAGPPVSRLLHQTEADQRLKAGHKDAAFPEIVFVVKADRFEGHARSPRPEGEGLAQLMDIVTAPIRRKTGITTRWGKFRF